MSKIYFGDGSGKARHPKKLYVGGEDGLAHLVKKAYAGGEDGLAHQIWPFTLLPRAYQRVEYIRNTNIGGYIKTGIEPNSNTRMVLEFSVAGTTLTNGDRVAGTLLNNANFGLTYSHSSASASYSIVPYFNASPGVSAYSFSYGSRIVLDLNRQIGQTYINNSLYCTFTNTFSSVSGRQIILYGGQNSSGSILAAQVPYNFFHFQIYQSGTLTRDMYPCWRRSDEAVGMYDLVNSQFYGNDGTGIFYKGPDID